MIHRNVSQYFGAAESPDEPKILTLAATFSLSTLKPQLEKWLQVISSPHRIEVVPCRLPHHYLIDPEHGLIRSSNGIHVVLFRLDDWNNFDEAGCCSDEIHPESRKLVERNLRLTIECLEAAADRPFGSLILVLCPLSLEHYRRKGVRQYFETVETRLNEALASCSHYTLMNATTLMPEPELAVGDGAGPPYTKRFFERLSRRIGQRCYGAESRPWKALVLSPGEHARAQIDVWQDFIASQWRYGRRMAVIGEHPVAARGEAYLSTNLSSSSVSEKVRQLTRELLISEEDLMFLGRGFECREIAEHIPNVLALPAFDPKSDWAAILRELWCLQPIPEIWLSEADAPKPSLPRLSAPLLLKLAMNPEWPARDLLKRTLEL